MSIDVSTKVHFWQILMIKGQKVYVFVLQDSLKKVIAIKWTVVNQVLVQLTIQSLFSNVTVILVM